MKNDDAPQNLDAEKAVLGAVLLVNTNLAEAADTLRPEMFYRQAHARIFEAMQALARAQRPIDLVTLTDVLSTREWLDSVGGPAYITRLVDGVPRTGNAKAYADLVLKAWRLREFQALMFDARRDVTDSDDDRAFMVAFAGKVVALAETASRDDGYTMIGDLMAEYLDEMAQGPRPPGLAYSLSSVTEITGGLHPGDLVIVAGRTRMGKTAAMLNLITTLSGRAITSLTFSLEMGKRDLRDRILTAETRIPYRSIQRITLSETEQTSVTEAARRAFEWRAGIDDRGGLTVAQIEAQCLKFKRTRGALDVVFVDYVQLLRGTSQRMQRYEALGQISGDLKALAKALQIPIVVLAQLNRDAEDKKALPELKHLRESGNLEQDADTVILLHRKFEVTQELADYYKAQWIIAKCRRGETSIVECRWDGDTQRFTDDTAPGAYDARQRQTEPETEQEIRVLEQIALLGDDDTTGGRYVEEF